MIVSRKNTLDLFAEFDALNLGTGDTFPSNAIALDDSTGTFRTYILLRQFEDQIEKTSGQVTLSATAQDFSGNTIFSCSASYWIGSTRDWGDTPISTDATWDSFDNGGTLNGFHDYLAGTITSGSAFNFAKLTFAENEGYLNASGVTINFDLTLTNGVVDNVNTNDRSFNGLGYIKEYLNSPRGIIRLPNNNFFVNGYGTEQVFAGDSSVIVDDGDKQWTDRSFEYIDLVTLLTNKGGKSYVQLDTSNPNDPNDVFYIGSPTYRGCMRVEISGYTEEGVPNYANLVNLNTAGTGRAPWSFVLYPYYTNGTPMLIRGAFNGTDNTQMWENTSGTYASPNYVANTWGGNTLGSTGVWSNTQVAALFLTTTNVIYALTSARVNFDGTSSPVVNTLRRYTLNGGGVATNPLDWSHEILVIGDVTSNTTPTTGTGLVAVLPAWGFLYVDENNTVNGEPVIYLSCTPNHCVQRIRHNGGITGTAADWDVDIILGTVNTAGDTNGIGGLLSQPSKSLVEGTTMYLPLAVGGKVKKVDLTTFEITEWKGGGDFGSNSAQTEGKTY